MIYCFDIDGTLCTDTGGKYASAEPHPQIIAQVNALFTQGHRIILYTARGSSTGMDWRSVTERQLKEWGIQHHELHFGKPRADVFVDDKAVNVAVFRERQLA